MGKDGRKELLLHCAGEIREASVELSASMVDLRRRLHAKPELGLDNPLTQNLIVETLEDIGISGLRRGQSCSSVLAEILGEGGGPGRGRLVALRADTDALPIRERTGLACASQFDGRMHACGHDAHVAMLLGAAAILYRQRARFAGTVRLLFQPGEEGYAGAAFMIAEGALEGVDAAFALHVGPETAVGEVAVRSGTMLAAVDTFFVSFKGAGGHASMPHLCSDPIPAIGPFVDGLSHVVARETDPTDRIVLSVTRVDAGSSANIIPPHANCEGTIRSLSEAGRKRARDKVRRVAEGVAAAAGLEVDVRVTEGYPATVNHPRAVELLDAAAALAGLELGIMDSPIMGAEDFAYVLERVPGAMAFVGCRTPGGGPLHSDVMAIDEGVLSHGAALHVCAALSFLADGGLSPSS